MPEGVSPASYSQAVSPDGRFVLAVDADGSSAIYSIETGERKPILRMEPGEQAIGWTGDGESVYAYRPSVPARVYQIELKSGRRKLWKELVLPDPAGIYFIRPPHISSDGKSYAYNYSRLNRLINMTRNIALAVVICGFPCLAKTPSTTLQVDVDNYVLYNYDTFDTTQFGTNPTSTSVPMKTYNYHISIGDIVAVGGKPAKGTLLCTHTMFVLSPTATVGSMKAIADTSRAMMDDCSLEILTDGGVAVGTI